MRTHYAFEIESSKFQESENKAYQACSFDNRISIEAFDFHAVKGRKHDVYEISITPIVTQIFAIPFMLL